MHKAAFIFRHQRDFKVLLRTLRILAYCCPNYCFICHHKKFRKKSFRKDKIHHDNFEKKRLALFYNWDIMNGLDCWFIYTSCLQAKILRYIVFAGFYLTIQAPIKSLYHNWWHNFSRALFHLVYPPTSILFKIINIKGWIVWY